MAKTYNITWVLLDCETPKLNPDPIYFESENNLISERCLILTKTGYLTVAQYCARRCFSDDLFDYFWEEVGRDSWRIEKEDVVKFALIEQFGDVNE